MEKDQNEKRLLCYSTGTINKIIGIANQLEIKGITNITGLAAIMNLLNEPDKTIEGE